MHGKMHGMLEKRHYKLSGIPNDPHNRGTLAPLATFTVQELRPLLSAGSV